MIPYDCISIIVSFSHLKQRYNWSIVHRTWAFTAIDWNRFGIYYKLTNPSRKNVKYLCEGHFEVQTRIQVNLHHLWSEHFQAPLCIWSPLTTGKLCVKYKNNCRMLFRSYPFVNFIRNLTNTFCMKSKCLTEKGVSVIIWRKSIPMVYISRDKRVQKLHISSAFKMKMTNFVRVLLEFRVRENCLHLNARRLEFLL